jgi:hypothetical protein
VEDAKTLRKILGQERSADYTLTGLATGEINPDAAA